ncbi:radical SAM/SPASM domain-containing protein [Nanoarchaeota archaeon]
MKENHTKPHRKDEAKGTSNAFTRYTEIKTERVKKWEDQKSAKYHEYRKKWVEYPKELKVPEFPFHIGVRSNSTCNLLCEMCPRTIGIKEERWVDPEDIDFQTYKKIVDEASEKGAYAVSLNGLGEIMMHKGLIEMVKYAKSKGIIDVFFHTNATMMTQNMIEALLDAGLDRVIISVDSPYKEKYEKIRVGANYDKVIRNIRNLFETRERKGLSSPLIRINMVKFPDVTIEELESAKELFLSMADSLGFLEYIDYNSKTEPPVFPEGYKSKFICPELLNRLTIREDGSVVNCCVTLNTSQALELGNVKEISLEAMWNSDKEQELRQLHINGEFYKIPDCRKCDFAVQEDKRLREEAEEKTKNCLA